MIVSWRTIFANITEAKMDFMKKMVILALIALAGYFIYKQFLEDNLKTMNKKAGTVFVTN